MSTSTDDRLAPQSREMLRADLTGPVAIPGEPLYDRARRAWNLRAEHSPAAVVLAETPEDVRTTVRHAVAAGLGVGVMATGHGTGSVCGPDGILINTARMRAVAIDPERRQARVEAGVIWQQVVDAAAPYG